MTHKASRAISMTYLSVPLCHPVSHQDGAFFGGFHPGVWGVCWAEIHILSLLQNHQTNISSGRDSFHQSFWIYQIQNKKKKLPRKFISSPPKKKKINNANAQGRLALRHQNRSSTSRTRSWKSLSLAPGRGQWGSDLSWSDAVFWDENGRFSRQGQVRYGRFRKLVKKWVVCYGTFIRRPFWWMLLDVVVLLC